MNIRTLGRRLRRLSDGMAHVPAPGMFRILSRHGLSADDFGIRQLLVDLDATGFDPEVIILETIRRVLVGNENDAQDVVRFWRNVDPIVRSGRTLIVSHHMRKLNMGNNRTRDRASGSTDMLGGTDDALAFKRAAKNALIIEPVKCREAEEAEPFTVSFLDLEPPEGPVTLGYEGTPDDMQARATQIGQAEAIIEGSLTGANDASATSQELYIHLAQHDIAQRTGQRALKAMVERGQLDHPKRGIYRLVKRQAPTPYKYDSGGASGARPLSNTVSPPGDSVALDLAALTPLGKAA